MKRNPTIGGQRQCTQCGNTYPDTPEYFPYGTRTKDGTVHLRADCRTCYNDRARTIDARRRRLAGVKPRNLRADPARKPILEPPARCKSCHNEANRRARQEARQRAEKAYSGNEVFTWTRPPSDAHWGYCSDEHIWTHGNGRCHCGAEWVEVVQIAPMYENLVRG